jgi:cytochrome b involved in lipid metabolism
MSESSMIDKDELPFFTKEEISQHNTPEDNWMCINGLVYNFTGFENEHPGGKESKFIYLLFFFF